MEDTVAGIVIILGLVALFGPVLLPGARRARWATALVPCLLLAGLGFLYGLAGWDATGDDAIPESFVLLYFGAPAFVVLGVLGLAAAWLVRRLQRRQRPH